jgi:serine/threonine-protein kinase
MSSDPLLSKTLGNYEIVDRLGRGGMATVYRARQTNMQRDVAIKVMSDELADDPQFIARFELEAQVIANLQHPRVLPVHDFGHEGELFYLVMRLIEGDTLYQRLLNGPLTLSVTNKFLGQIAEALDYAHNQGVIHRDLKPNNILLDQWDNVYLMDFGLAKMLAASQQLTASGAMLGTPAYMAPEQWRGDPIDPRTDIYALGVILYEMVTGRLPFESDTPYSLMYKHLHDAPPSPREFLPNLPAAVEQVVIQSLTKEPGERFQTAGDLAAAFNSVIQGGPVTLPARSARVLPSAPTIPPTWSTPRAPPATRRASCTPTAACSAASRPRSTGSTSTPRAATASSTRASTTGPTCSAPG